MWLDRYEAILCDLDGCLISGSTVLPGAREFMSYAGQRLWIISSNSTHAPIGLSEKLARLGLEVRPERIVLAGAATDGLTDAVSGGLLEAPGGASVGLPPDDTTDNLATAPEAPVDVLERASVGLGGHLGADLTGVSPSGMAWTTAWMGLALTGLPSCSARVAPASWANKARCSAQKVREAAAVAFVQPWVDRHRLSNSNCCIRRRRT